MVQEEFENFEFHLGEFNEAVVVCSSQLPFPGIQKAPVERIDGWLRNLSFDGGAIAPKQRADAQDDFLDVKWLGHIIIGAALEDCDPIDRRGLARDDDNGNVQPAPDFARQIESTAVVDTDFERDQCYRVALEILEYDFPAISFDDRKSLGLELTS